MVKGQFYNGAFQEYGKNRVQYNVFQWKYLDFQKFKIYYYAGGKDLAIYTAKAMEKNIYELEKLMDYKVNEKLEVIVYNKQSHFKQSNIGVSLTDEYNVGGVNRIVGNKVFVYFEGNKRAMEQQVRGALAQVMLRQITYGGNWKDVLQSSTNLNMPEWFIEGFVSYVAKGWNAEIETTIKDGVLTEQYEDFSNLDRRNSVYGGHALWYYIEQVYGKDVIPVLMYMAKVSSNIPRAFNYVLGVSFDRLVKNMDRFYKTRFYDDIKHQEELKGEQLSYKIRKNRVYYGFKLSPDKTKLAYVENHYGRYKVRILNRSTGKSKIIFKAEPKLERMMDFTFPVIEWHPNSQALVFFTEYKGGLDLVIYTIDDEEKTTIPINDLEKVLSFDYHPDGKQMVLSATRRGQTNLYLYKVIGNSYQPIIEDFYDDLDPHFINNGNSIIFSSNRDSTDVSNKTKNEVFAHNKDLYIFDLKQINRPLKTLTRLTNTPEINERHPEELEANKYLYISDKNGLRNRFVGMRDSVISSVDTTINYRYFFRNFPMTNYVTGIQSQQISSTGKNYLEVVFQNNKNKVFVGEVSSEPPYESIQNTSLKVKDALSKGKDTEVGENKSNKTQKVEKEKVVISNSTTVTKEEEKEPFDVEKVDINNYQFIPDSTNKDEKKQQNEAVTKNNKGRFENLNNQSVAFKEPKSPIQPFEMPGEKLHKVNFARDYTVNQLDNNFLNQSYQRYSGPGSVYFNPGISGFAKVGVSDLFEDIKLMGALRIPMNFNSSEYLVIADYLRNRFNHRILLYRQSLSDQLNPNIGQGGLNYKWRTNEAKYRLTFPFNEAMCIRGTLGYRSDQSIVPAYDDVTLNTPNRFFNTGTFKVEWVYDDAIPMGLNLWKNSKLKVFGEILQEIDNDQGTTIVLGGDFRHSIKITKKMIWVNRLSGSTSFGSKKLLYYMGAVDSWILRRNPDFNPDVDVDPTEPYAYQTVATPMRGFIQNARNGNSFVLINSELRMNIIQMVNKNGTLSEFAQSFQLAFFGDLGTAWNGPHPYSPENFFNTQSINDGPITINLINQREPIIGGLGFGIRGKLAGYFLKLDAAWGVENLSINAPIIYLSLALDI